MQSARALDLLRLGPGDRAHLAPDVASPAAVARLIAGFANAQGGTIVFGARKRGEIVGLRDVQAATTAIARAVELVSPNPLVEPHIVTLDAHTVILLEVARGSDTPYTTADGRIWVRNGSRIAQASAAQAADLAERAIAGASFTPLPGRAPSGRLHAKTAPAPVVDLDHIMLKLERLIIANAELAHKLDHANSWRSRITDQVIGAIMGLLISVFVFYVLGIG